MSKILTTDIRVNNFVNPIGINGDTPEFSWRISGAVKQSAWQIRAAHSTEDLSAGNFIWDSGKVISDSMSAIPYGKGNLQSREYICFQLSLWDENDVQGEWSDIHFFEAGLLSEKDWDAQYFGFPAGWAGAAIAFQKIEELKKKYKKLRLYVAGSCVYSYFNGHKLGGNSLLQPPQTDYSQSFHYMTYDLTDLAVIGRNNLSFYVGYGWAGSVQLRYRFEGDGELITRSHISSMPVCTKSPIVRNSFFGGEEYDATKELPANWREADAKFFPDYRSAMRLTTSTANTPRGFEEEPITPQEEIKPVLWEKLGDGHYTVDFGRNFAGFCRLKVKAPAGTTIKMLFSEMRNDDKTANQANLLGEVAMDTYTAAGTGDWEIFEPRFTYHGFRYVEVIGLTEEFTTETLTGVVIRNNCRRAGDFKCSNPLVNEIFKIILRSEESNLFAVPTDCPQRTERMGWLNDMMARNESALYLFDESNLISKWLQDIAEAQDPITGEVPMTAPLYWGFDTDPVCSSFIEATLNNYKFYGKKVQMQKLYPKLRHWIDRLLSLRREDGIFYKGPVGDWVPPLKFNNGRGVANNVTVPRELVSTALIFYAINQLSQIASILDNKQEVAYLQAKADEVQNAFLKKWHSAHGRLNEESQAAYAYAIYCKLFPEAERQSAADRLAELFADNNYKHITGNIGTKYLIEVLAQYGYAEHVWKLINSEDYPGWGFMIANGATTLWERWELSEGRGMNSHNHPMLGAPCGWLFRHIAGIQLHEDSCGGDKIILNPIFVNDLEFAEASYDGRSGLIKAAWHRENGKIIYDFEITSGFSAEVKMSDGSFKKFAKGSYSLIF